MRQHGAVVRQVLAISCWLSAIGFDKAAPPLVAWRRDEPFRPARGGSDGVDLDRVEDDLVALGAGSVDVADLERVAVLGDHPFGE